MANLMSQRKNNFRYIGLDDKQSKTVFEVQAIGGKGFAQQAGRLMFY
jgi:hypothetical protein